MDFLLGGPLEGKPLDDEPIPEIAVRIWLYVPPVKKKEPGVYALYQLEKKTKTDRYFVYVETSDDNPDK